VDGPNTLADADPSSLDRTAADVQADGHRIWVSPNAEQAREVLSSGALDAIITQTVLPVGNGLDVLALGAKV
jgi:DNA-binding response OmpR family regulator